MTIVDNSYQINFSTSDIKQFNKIFATFLQDLTSTKDLPNFKVSCTNNRIIIQLSAHPKAFFFISQIIQEFENYKMDFVSEKQETTINDIYSQNTKANETTENANMVEEAEETTGKAPSKEYKKNFLYGMFSSRIENLMSDLIRNNMMSFTFEEVRKKFCNIYGSSSDLNVMISLAEKSGLITYDATNSTYTIVKN